MATVPCTVLGVVLTLATLASATINPDPQPLELILPGNSLIATPEALRLAHGVRQRVIDHRACSNRKICFALDGSGSMTTVEFTKQMEFVELITAIASVDTKVNFAAVQYGLRNIEVSSLTDDVNQFLLDVAASQSTLASRTFIATGLAFCIQELRVGPEDSNKIVLLGDGRSNFEGNPVPLARRFRRPRGDASICAVGIGFRDRRVLRRITGSRNRVLAIDNYFQLLDILDRVVTEICELHD